jgi:hypothetical protein
MSLEYFERTVEQVRAEAENLRGNVDARRNEISQDRTLSDEGKQQALAEVTSNAKPKLKELRAREDKLIADKINELESRIDSKTGNTATDVIAFRDAQDRAERLEDPDEAERLIARAMRTGDTSLAHAVFRKAMDAGWPSVTRTFTSANPELTDVVRDLGQLTKFREQTFNRTIAYGIFG